MTSKLPAQKQLPKLYRTVLPAWGAPFLAAVLLVSAMAIPWFATWQNILHDDGAGNVFAPDKPVQLSPDLVEVPSGSFVMGSPQGEPDRRDDEEMAETTITPFAICRTEVTVAQWRGTMGTNPNACSDGCEDRHPVQGISFYEAIRYLNRLTAIENELDVTREPPLTRCYDVVNWTWDRECTGYRLPTEAEWEYAMRAGTRTMYFFGNRTDELCIYGNGDGSTCDDQFKKLAPVASFLPNPWGLFDMQGNVYEWVWDEQGKRRSEMAASGQDVVRDSDRRVLRGGSFLTSPGSMRSASRTGDWPGDTDYDYGFRCARSIFRNH